MYTAPTSLMAIQLTSYKTEVVVKCPPHVCIVHTVAVGVGIGDFPCFINLYLNFMY